MTARMEEVRRQLERLKKIGTDQPRRCETNQVGAMGECLACDAEQGEHCQLAALEAKP